MEKQLLLIEGLPCSGKSTTSKYIAKYLETKGHNVIYIDEGTGKHLAGYEFQSYISDVNLKTFSEAEQKTILKGAYKAKNGYIVELKNLQGELFEKVLRYKIYDFLEWHVERESMLHKWEEFANSVASDTIYVFNCCFLQNPRCETMMRFGFEIGESRQYIRDIYQRIKKLNPICIYL